MCKLIQKKLLNPYYFLYQSLCTRMKKISQIEQFDDIMLSLYFINKTFNYE